MSDSYVRVPPDGAGKKIHTTQHTVGGNEVQTQHVHISDLSNPEYTQEINNKGAALVTYSDGEPILDTFSNLKVSEETYMGIYEFSQDSYSDLFYDEELSGATVIYYPETSSMGLITTSDLGSSARRTSNRYHYYQPGSYMLYKMVISCGDTGKDGNVRKWGPHDDNNGIFFALNGTGLTIGFRSDISGSIIDSYIPQSQWNVDKLDGTGLSGVDLDLTKSYTYFIAYNWPAGLARYGVYYPRIGRVTCHIESGAGINPYSKIRYGSLPIRYSNRNTGAAAGGSQLNIVMTSVQVTDNIGYTFWRFGDLGCENITVTNSTPILSFRPKILLDNGVPNRINTYPETLSVFSSGATTKLEFAWCLPIALSGATWDMNSIDGPLEADSGATSIDRNDDSFWLTFVLYAPKDTAVNLDLTQYFEINDEGILLSADGITQSAFSILGTPLGGNESKVSMTISYKSLY